MIGLDIHTEVAVKKVLDPRVSIVLMLKVALILCAVALLPYGDAMAAEQQPAPPPQFSLHWSEYPSWSVFGVLHSQGLIDGSAGKQGPIEKKWNVDIVLKEATYDAGMAMYGSETVDAGCFTTLDALNQALGRKSVVVTPTSTSIGADGTVTLKTVTDLDGLKPLTVYGLDASVSRYVFDRNIELQGQNPDDFKFSNRDPETAATAMQTGSNDPIIVWNPFLMETLKRRKDVHVLFDSSTIPEEVIDAVIVAQAALDRPGGDRFVGAILQGIDTINRQLADPTTRDTTLVAIGKKFSSLELEPMRTVVRQTRFYDTPDKALDLMTSDRLRQKTDLVVGFCVKRAIVPKKPAVGYGTKTQAPDAALRFDPSYLQAYIAQR